MIKRIVPILLIFSFALIAMFGALIPAMDHMGHETGCPFVPGSVGQCTALLEHAVHWRSLFAATLGQALILLSAALMVFFSVHVRFMRDPAYERYRLGKRVPKRPPLMQGLFSQGILHRKEPSFGR